MVMNLFNICFLYSTQNKKNYSQKQEWHYVTLRNHFFLLTNICMWFPANCMLEIAKHMNLLDCLLCIDLKINKKKIYCMSISCKLKNGVWRYVTAFVTLRNVCTFKHQMGVVAKQDFEIFMDPETTNKIRRHVFYRI